MLDSITVLTTPGVIVSAEDGCVVLRGNDERLVFTGGQATALADMISPFSLVLAGALRYAAERAIGTDLGSGGEGEEEA